MPSVDEETTIPVREDPKQTRLWILVVGTICTIFGAAVIAYYAYTWVLEAYEVEPFEAARTAVTMIGVPTAAGAVFVALRNLRLKERQDHTDKQRLVDAQRAYDLSYNTEHNRRRIDRETQFRARYVSAAEQIGNPSAAVRLAGINAMAQLADDWRDQRQACVDVLCAYLRLPQQRIELALDEADTVVRDTAQQRLLDGLRIPPKREGGEVKWPNTDLDLRGALLRNFRMPRGTVRSGKFAGAVFEGDTTFIGSELGNTSFRNAHFKGKATFSQCRFRRANFHEATFSGPAKFRGTVFEGIAQFAEVTFRGPVILEKLQAAKPLYFYLTEFRVVPAFSGPMFDSQVRDCTQHGELIDDYNLRESDTLAEDDEELSDGSLV